jgi:hypothetical protein
MLDIYSETDISFAAYERQAFRCISAFDVNVGFGRYRIFVDGVGARPNPACGWAAAQV